MPSDYMVTTMRKLDMLEKLDLAKIPNAKYISADLRKLPFDPTGEYTLPYTTGITGIIYNKNMSKKLLPNGTICGTRNIKDMYCF